MSWDIAWGAFLAAAGVGFGTIEYLGIRARNAGRPSGTLTTTFRHWLGVAPPHWRRWILGPAFAALLVWLLGHMLWGWGP